MIPILDLSDEIKKLRPELDAAIAKVLDHGRFIMGPEVKEIEETIAKAFQVKHAIGVNSGTDALVIALRAAGTQEGDEVITTPFTFFATAESISICGAMPVFADILPDGYNIDPESIRKNITPKTKAIMPVHLYGESCMMGKIMDIANEYNLKVIEDCAQSFGARYFGDCRSCDGNCSQEKLQGSFTGTIGDAGAYSFFPSKNLGAFGDGGMIVTNDDEIAAEARMLRVHGAKKKYHNEVLGYNSRLDTIQAAILSVKFPHLEKANQGRFEVAQRYNEAFAELKNEILTPRLTKGHVFHQYTVRILNKDRNEVQQLLKEKEIGTMIYYPIPCHKLPVYDSIQAEVPKTDMATKQVISLPIWPNMPIEKQNKVIDAVKEILG